MGIPSPISAGQRHGYVPVDIPVNAKPRWRCKTRTPSSHATLNTTIRHQSTISPRMENMWRFRIILTILEYLWMLLGRIIIKVKMLPTIQIHSLANWQNQHYKALRNRMSRGGRKPPSNTQWIIYFKINCKRLSILYRWVLNLIPKDWGQILKSKVI